MSFATLYLKLRCVRVEVLDEQATTESLTGSLPEFNGCATRRDSNIPTSRFVFELSLTLTFAQHASDGNTEKPTKPTAKSQAATRRSFAPHTMHEADKKEEELRNQRQYTKATASQQVSCPPPPPLLHSIDGPSEAFSEVSFATHQCRAGEQILPRETVRP